MTDVSVTLASFLEEAVDTGVSPELAEIVSVLASTSLEISKDIRASNWHHEKTAGAVNVQGEIQKPLDVIANERTIKSLASLAQVSFAVSEELEDAVAMSDNGKYAVVFDPLDGSSNVDVNITVGSIFSIIPATEREQLLQTGRCQHFAAYAAYGPSTLLTLSFGRDVSIFGADENSEYRLVERRVQVPLQNPEYAINASRKSEWPSAVASFIHDCELGEVGPLARRYNMRWVGSMVAELHRILMRGGLFLYPGQNIDGPGKLRLLYEANPMSFLLEAAGGTASTGRQPILDIRPTSLHQRVGVLMGSADEMTNLMSYTDTNPRR